MPYYTMHELDIRPRATRYLILMKDYGQSVTTAVDSLIHDTEHLAKAHCYLLIRVLLYPLT